MTTLPFALSYNFEEILESGGLHVTNIVPHGPSGIAVKFIDKSKEPGSIIVTQADHENGNEYLHASIAYNDQAIMPSYEDMKLLHRAVFGRKRWAYQVFAPHSNHVNIRSNALHLWGLANGDPILPNFGSKGTI